jgi:hypothetical protein
MIAQPLDDTRRSDADGDDDHAFTRWQAFRIAQLGLCLSLFLTFAVATLGFSLSLIVADEQQITDACAKLAIGWSVVFGLSSVLLGSVACLTRLADFRATSKVTRYRGNPTRTADVKGWRTSYEWYGWWTWLLFRGQLALFALQVIGLIVALKISFNNRVF